MIDIVSSLIAINSIVMQKSGDCASHFFTSSISLRRYIEEFKTVILCAGRRTGHTTTIGNMADSEDIVIVKTKALKENFFQSFTRFKDAGVVFNHANCEHMLRVESPVLRKKAKRIFVDDASTLSSDEMFKLYNFIEQVSTPNTVVILIG